MSTAKKIAHKAEAVKGAFKKTAGRLAGRTASPRRRPR